MYKRNKQQVGTYIILFVQRYIHVTYKCSKECIAFLDHVQTTKTYGGQKALDISLFVKRGHIPK